MKKNHKNILYAIIGLSVLLRVATAVWFGDQVVNLPGTQDQISYHTLALRVLDGHGFSFGEGWWPVTAANAPTAHWSFLYTFYLILTYTVFGPHPLAARILQAVLVGILQPLLAFLIGRRLFIEITGLVSALFVTIYAYFVYYSATLMTEPFYISAILAIIYVTIKLTDSFAAEKPGAGWTQALGLGLALGWLLGAAVLLRQVFLMFVPFIFIWIWWVLRKANFLKAFVSTAIAGFVVILMIIPFTIYNYARFDRFVLLNTNAGYAFYLANHPIYGTHFIPILPAEMGSYQQLIPQELYYLDEATLDQELLKMGMQFVADDPMRYLLLSVSRLPALFMFWPSPESGMISNISRVASFGLFLPFMIYGLILALFSRKYITGLTSPALLPIFFATIYAAIHILSWALVRYRLPIDAVMLVFAAYGVMDLYERIKPWLTQNKIPHRMVKQA